MPEAAIIILDNSNYAINGDYQPTRWLSQIEAAGLLIQTKMEQNHEVAVGIALSGGKQVEIICAPSTDVTKVTAFLYGIKLGGLQKLTIALQTAALALKHRLNPNLTQRIICFVASTITENIEELKIICKKLKKNNIAVDFIALGDLSEAQREKLDVMNETVKGETNKCGLVYVQPEGNLSDALFNFHLAGNEGSGPAMMINEVDDPELRMALELSLLDEQHRLAAQAAAGQVSNPANANEQQDLQQRALQLSMDEQKPEKKQEKKQ